MTNSNQKGKRGEREAAQALQAHLGIDARRGQQYAGGEDSPDLVTSLPGVHFEVKRVNRLSLPVAMHQAECDAGDKVPVVLSRRDHCEWLVTVPLARLTRLAAEIIGAIKLQNLHDLTDSAEKRK